MKELFSKALSILLSMCLLFSITAGLDFSAYAGTSITVAGANGNITISDLKSDYASKVKSFLSDSRWKHGTSWSQISPKLSSYSSKGCCAYVADFAKYVYGANTPNGTSSHKKVANIKSGDILKFPDKPHYIVVLKRNGNKLITAEGAYSNKVRVTSSGYTINGSSIYQNGKSYSSNVVVAHFKDVDDSTTTPPDLMSSTYRVDLNLNGTKSQTVNIAAFGSLPSSYKFRSTSTEYNASTSWGSWSGDSCPLTITGKYYGYDAVKVDLIDNNDKILSTIYINVYIESNSYNVYFNTDGGECAVYSKSVHYKGNYGSLPTATKKGYCFNGWKDSSGNRVYEDSINSVNSSQTLYACWSTCSHNSKTYFIEKVATCTENGIKHWKCSTCNYEWNEIIYATGHKYDKVASVIEPTCVKQGYTVYKCSCGAEKKSDYINSNGHKHVENNQPATLTTNGLIVTVCTSCGELIDSNVINSPKEFSLSSTSYIYDGKVKNPSVIVKDTNGKVIDTSNYTISYASGRKNVGKYAVKITFKGNYSGTKTLYFTIKPKATSISSVTASSKGFTVKWKKQATQTTGYQIQYATDSKFTKNINTVTISKNSTTSKKISKLSAKKKYYVRVRTYKTVKINGKTTKIYSAWSKVKTVTTKK